MRNTITRTIISTTANCLVYNDGKINPVSVVIPSAINSVELAEKYIRKNIELINGKLVTVEKLVKDEKLYGMTEADFVTYGRKVEQRDKTTRDLISKTVNGRIGTLVYMDSNYNIGKIDVMIDPKANLDKQARNLAPKGTKGVTVENIRDTSALYVISEADFMAHAHEMVDHQHYKK